MIHGDDILILNNAGTAIIAASRSCEVETQSDVVEVSGPSTGSWKQFVGDRKSWMVTVNYLVTTPLSDLLQTGTTVILRIKPRSGSTYLYGQAIVKTCKITATKMNLAQGSFQFQGTGALQ